MKRLSPKRNGTAVSLFQLSSGGKDRRITGEADSFPEERSIECPRTRIVQENAT